MQSWGRVPTSPAELPLEIDGFCENDASNIQYRDFQRSLLSRR